MARVLLTIIIFYLFPLFWCYSQTYPLPYIESFDTCAVNQPLNGNAGIKASAHVYVTPYGVVGNCAEFQMTDTALSFSDTITSPTIGPLTTNTATSFYFRVVKFVGNVPSVYHMAYTDKAIIYVGGVGGTGSLYLPQFTIDSNNQNNTTAYVKVTVPAPAWVNGYTGRFKIIASNPSGNNWRLEFDSLVVRDTLNSVIRPVLADSVTNVSCRGASTGGIKVIASGALPPYRYLWSTGDTTIAVSGLPAGAYTVTVTDSLGATAVLTDTIRQPAFALLLDSLAKTPATCYGGATGTSTVYASGGTVPYYYRWSTIPIQTLDSATHLTAGNYNVTVTDALGCSLMASVHITQPSVPFITTTSTTQSTTGNNGSATIITSGGVSPVTFVWSTTPPQYTATISGLTPGLYEVTVTDGSNCVITDTVFVAFPNGIAATQKNLLKVYPNPAGDKIYIQLMSDTELAGVSFIDINNKEVMAYKMASGFINTTPLAEGMYIIRVQTSKECFEEKIAIKR